VANLFSWTPCINLNRRYFGRTFARVYCLFLYCVCDAGSSRKFETETASETQGTLSGHKNVHTGQHKCPECGKCCRTSSELARHRREKPYKCHTCNKAFRRSYDLNVHMRVHTGDKPHKCSLCNKCYGYLSGLQSHKRQVHSNRRPYHCPYCGKTFATKAYLKRHVRIHTVTKPYSCRHYTDSYTSPEQLKTHLLKSHNEGS